jgi:hypothetical protein
MYSLREFYTLINIIEDNEFIVKTTIRTIILLFLSIDLSYFLNKSSS